MNLSRKELSEHLRRISCRGQVKEAVFSGAFATAAVTPDRLLLVIAPEFDGEGLEAPNEEGKMVPVEVGIADLNLMDKALGIVPGAEDDAGVDISYIDNRLVINEQGRGLVRLLTAAPRTIATRIEQDMVDKVSKLIGSTVIPLDRMLIDFAKAAYGTLKAIEIEVIVGPNGGMIRVGDPNSNMAEFPAPNLKDKEEYTLNFGEQFLDVLSTISPDAILHLAGPGGAAMIQDGDYRYVLSPRSYSADRKVPTGAPKKGGKRVKKSETAEPAATP